MFYSFLRFNLISVSAEKVSGQIVVENSKSLVVRCVRGGASVWRGSAVGPLLVAIGVFQRDNNFCFGW